LPQRLACKLNEYRVRHAAIAILLSRIEDVTIHKLWEILSQKHHMREGGGAMEIYREQPELSLSKQELIVYPHQGWLVVYTLFLGLGLVLCSGVIVYWSIFWSSADVLPFHHMIVELMVLSAFAIIVLSWAFWNFLRALFVRQPVLVVTGEGIQMHSLGSGNFFISWPEIETIAVHSSFLGSRSLCIHPKNPNQYLSRFKALKRLWMGSYGLVGLPPITVALFFLDMPIATFFQQVSQRYAYQVRKERIMLLP
jgi:hypothetical protein